MPPESRGRDKQSSARPNLHSQSTPTLPTLRTLSNPNSETSSIDSSTPNNGRSVSPNPPSPSEPASIDDFPFDGSHDPASFSVKPEQDEDEGEDEGEQQEHVSKLPTRPLYSHTHSRSYTSLGPSAFAPPFYNRPPTPLPPSPSLTSLLRPTFSTQNSRPNTPEPSSDEGNGTSSSLLRPPSQHPSGNGGTTTPSSIYHKPIPRASPRVPTYEYYGFTLYLTSSLAFIVYVLWSLLPSPFLHALGIYYYPNRWWALAIPAWTVMFMLYIYVALASYNTGYLTVEMSSVECVVDEAAHVAVLDARGGIMRGMDGPSWGSGEGGSKKKKAKGGGGGGGGGGSRASSRRPSLSQSYIPAEGAGWEWRELWNEGTDAVMDVPLGGVCEILYGEGRDRDGTHDTL